MTFACVIELSEVLLSQQTRFDIRRVDDFDTFDSRWDLRARYISKISHVRTVFL